MNIPLSLMLLFNWFNFEQSSNPEPIAVIELFTSEGCSSCPAADELLNQTIEQTKGKKVYALAFHVDYWNRLGWKDSYSTHQFTERQQNYIASLGLEGAYTPQIVVNGSNEFVGSNAAALNNALRTALATNAIINFAILRHPSALQVHYELTGDLKNCEVHFALISLHETTAVKRGENGGRTLKHANVVRQLITTKAEKSGDINFEASPLPAKNNQAIIAFVQRKSDGHIIAAAEVK